MIVQAAAFYAFSLVLIGSAVMVTVSRNTVHSVLFLILAFFQAAGLAVLLGAEFLAMILVVVYVGAVAVLFLFVVMMLDVGLRDRRTWPAPDLVVGGLVGAVLIAELTALAVAWKAAPEAAGLIGSPTPGGIDNAHALGAVLYTEYAYLFQSCGAVLLIAMVGAIVLTLRSRPGARRQNSGEQIDRSRDDAVEIRRVSSGEGVEI